MQRKQTKNKVKLVIFDMDGALVDVSQSYKIAIKKTAEFFLGKILGMEEIEEIKNKCMSKDYEAAELLIQRYGGDFRKEVIIKKFQEYYLGKNFMGLIRNEPLLVNGSLLKNLGKKYMLAVFTARPKEEAYFILDKYRLKRYFSTIITMEDVKEPNPDAEGLLMIMKKTKVKNNEVIYIGGNLADLKAAQSININFVGISTDDQYRKELLKSEGASIVLDSVNDLIKAIK